VIQMLADLVLLAFVPIAYDITQMKLKERSRFSRIVESNKRIQETDGAGRTIPRELQDEGQGICEDKMAITAPKSLEVSTKKSITCNGCNIVSNSQWSNQYTI
jgi:hypothetical protein